MLILNTFGLFFRRLASNLGRGGKTFSLFYGHIMFSFQTVFQINERSLVKMAILPSKMVLESRGQITHDSKRDLTSVCVQLYDSTWPILRKVNVVIEDTHITHENKRLLFSTSAN